MPQKSLSGYTPAEMFQKIRRIEIKTSRLVNELFGGRYLSTFKGRGMEFSDIREYFPGDDVRNIHWNVTARLGHPYVKRYTEERELTILMAVDVSRSHSFGSQKKFKSELAAELVSLLAFSSLKNNDKVGLLLFSDRIESYIPPRKSQSHTLRLVRDVLGFIPKGSKTNIDGALQYLNRVQKKRAVVFLVSDFIDSGFEKRLELTQQRHDSIAFVLKDPMEEIWPPIGKIIIDDAETGKRYWVDFSSDFLRQRYGNKNLSNTEDLEKRFKRSKMDRVLFQTHHDYIQPLMAFFKERAKRYR